MEGAEEVDQLSPRLVVTYDGGIKVLDAQSGKEITTIPTSQFTRLNTAIDGRHIMLSQGDEFRMLDSGLLAQWHEDHYHYFQADPRLTDTHVPAPKAGHVVNHSGATVLFSDGTAKAQVFGSRAFHDSQLSSQEAITYAGTDPHHGVAVLLANGNLLVTHGTTEERHTLREVTPGGEIVQEFTDCPGVHGEAAAPLINGRDVVAFGCTNGPVVYRDGSFHKVNVDEEYQRSGNMFSSPASPVVLADYKTMKPVKGGPIERPTLVGLLDTRTNELTKVDLESPYWFRSFARGENGESLVLTYDGKLHILDSSTGKHLHTLDVTAPWQEKEDWQQPGPNVKTSGDYAWISEPAARKIHVVKISSGELVKSFDLDVEVNEMAVATGKAEDTSAK
ncbi:hypothetical protein I6E29_04765 [Arcanobacterium haemolyticum]|nr:hypothetical protein [Arcanobacterium haemolyticum]